MYKSGKGSAGEAMAESYIVVEPKVCEQCGKMFVRAAGGSKYCPPCVIQMEKWRKGGFMPKEKK